MTNDSASAKEIHSKREILWRSSIDAHKKYIDPATGLFAGEFTRERNCPICESQLFEDLFVKEGGRYVKCRECEMLYLNPVLNDEFLADYYSTNHDIQSKLVEEDTEFYSRIYQCGLNLIESELVEKKNILDFGCSSGFFLDVAKKNGWEKTAGIELNKSESRLALSKGHFVYNDQLAKLEHLDNFDAITLWDVFEHLPDGSAYLKIFREMLTDSGVLFLQVPNAAGLAPRIMRDKCNMFDGLEHVNLYAPDTLRMIAERNGFKVTAMTSVISELSVLNNYVNYHHPYNGELKSTDRFLDLLDEKEILDSLLGYKLQVVLALK